MEDQPRKESRSSKVLKLIVKIAITAICLWYVSTKIDFSKAGEAIKKSNPLFLLLAAIAFVLSKIVAAYRLNIYFRNIRIHLSEWTNIKLYWLGMFYNLFLPGSISGDAYKVVLLKRRYDSSYKETTAAVLLDRFSGLLALGLILSAYGVIVLDKTLYDFILIAGSMATVLTLYLVVQFYFKDFLPGFWSTFIWGLIVQLTQVVCLYCI